VRFIESKFGMGAKRRATHSDRDSLSVFLRPRKP
jgi:hypothetical protein